MLVFTLLTPFQLPQPFPPLLVLELLGSAGLLHVPQLGSFGLVVVVVVVLLPGVLQVPQLGSLGLVVVVVLDPGVVDLLLAPPQLPHAGSDGLVVVVVVEDFHSLQVLGSDGLVVVVVLLQSLQVAGVVEEVVLLLEEAGSH